MSKFESSGSELSEITVFVVFLSLNGCCLRLRDEKKTQKNGGGGKEILLYKNFTECVQSQTPNDLSLYKEHNWVIIMIKF